MQLALWLATCSSKQLAALVQLVVTTSMVANVGLRLHDCRGKVAAA